MILQNFLFRFNARHSVSLTHSSASCPFSFFPLFTNHLSHDYPQRQAFPRGDKDRVSYVAKPR